MKNEPLPPGRQRVSARLGGSTGLNSVTVSSLGFPDLPAMQEIPVRVRKIRWRRHRLPIPVFLGFPFGSVRKESACNVGDLGSIPGLGRSPREGKGYPLQYSGLENSMNCIFHGITKNRTRPSAFHFTLTLSNLLSSRSLKTAGGISVGVIVRAKAEILSLPLFEGWGAVHSVSNALIL